MAVLFLLPALVWAKSNPAVEVIEKLQASYERIAVFEAQFEQSYRSRRFDEKTARGKVILAKPGKMRWDYEEPKGKTLVSNGKRLTLYDPEDQQALVAEQFGEKNLPVAISFLWGRGRLVESFHLSVVKDETTRTGRRVTLHCIPKQPIPNVEELYLTVRMAEPVVVEASRIIDSIGGENEIRFSDIVIRSKVPAGRFEFQPPQGTFIVPLNGGSQKPF